MQRYRRIRSAIVCAIVALVAYGAFQNSIFIAVVAVTLGIVALHFIRRDLTEVEHDERTLLIKSKAASTTLTFITVAMSIIGLSLIFLSGQGMGNYEQVGYLLAFQANIILVLNALLYFLYKKRLGG